MEKNANRTRLENGLARLGYELSKASMRTCMHAAGNHERIPRWEVSDGKHQDTVKGFGTLAEVADYLEECAIMESIESGKE